MLRDLQLDRVSYASINLWATLLGAVICLPIGRVFDQFGLRAVTAVLVVLLAAVVWLMSGVTGGVMVLFVLVLATRAFGQSALSVSSITVVGKSFDRHVGVAMGVYSVLLTILFAAAFVVVGTSVSEDGWRWAWAGVAYGLLLLGVPAALSIRERATAPVAEEPGSGPDLDLAAALRTPAFWVFAVATSLFGLVSSGLGLFNEAVLAERGFNQQTYVQFLVGTTGIGLLGQLGCGWLSTRWPMQRLLDRSAGMRHQQLSAHTLAINMQR
jgi:MFS family permease